MSQDALTHIIVTGQDPRGLPEFSALREGINKSSHPSQPELNWKLVESLALAILKPMAWICTRPLITPWRAPARTAWPDFAKGWSCWRP